MCTSGLRTNLERRHFPTTTNPDATQPLSHGSGNIKQRFLAAENHVTLRGGLPIVELGVVQEGSMVPEDSLINVVDVCSSITVKYCMRARVVKGQQETKNLAHSRERYLFFIVLYVMFICVYH